MVGTGADDILPALRRQFGREGFGAVEVSQSEVLLGATRLDPGGSLPDDVFADVLGVPTLWIPHSYLGCNQHAPDERVLVLLIREGLAMMTGIFWDVGEQ